MRLSGRQLEQFRDLIVEVFTLPEFDQLLRFHLGKKRENVALGDDFKEIAFKVIDEADAEGWLAQLIQAVQEERARHTELQAFLKQLELPASQPPALPGRLQRLGDFLQNRRLGRYGLFLALLLVISAGVFAAWYLIDRTRRQEESRFLDDTREVVSLDVNDLSGWINYGQELTGRSKPPPQILLQARVDALARRLWVARVTTALTLVPTESIQGLAALLDELLEGAPDVSADAELGALRQELVRKIEELGSATPRFLAADGIGERPVLGLCRDRSGELEPPWDQLLAEPAAERAAAASRNTAALLIDGRLRASAFRVASQLIMTVNFALSDVVIQPRPGVWVIRPGATVSVDFGRDSCDSAPREHPVTAIRYLDDWPGEQSIAFLEVASLNGPFEPLRLEAFDASRSPGPVAVGVLGFPHGAKSLMPGFLLGPDTPRPLGGPQNPLLYDSDTRPGSSGGPVIELGSGAVIGMHWGGKPQEEGEKVGIAEPMSRILVREPVQLLLAEG